MRIGSAFPLFWLCLFGVFSARSAHFFVTNDYPNVTAAYAAALPGETNWMSIDANLYVEPPLLFDGSKHLVIQSRGGRIIVASTNAPLNDTPGGALSLTGRVVSTFAYNYSARREADEIPHENITSFTRSLWWQWTAPTDGQAIFAVDKYDFHPLLDVFGQRHGLPVQLTENHFIWRSNTEASLVVVAGSNYLIRVAAEHTGFGGATLHVTMPDPPEHDQRSRARPLVGIKALETGNTYAATNEVDEPSHAGVGAGRSVWFRWTAPTNTGLLGHPLSLSTAGSDFGTVLAVYTTNAAGALVPVAASKHVNAAERYSRLRFVPDPEVTYFIAVDGATGSSQRSFVGNYVLRLDYSWVDLTSELVGLAPGEGESLWFTNQFAVAHYGFVPVGPLRIRVVARATNSVAGVHLLSAAGDSNLLTIPMVLTSSGPGGRGFLSTNFLRPGPLRNVDPGRPPFWGVFALLEEYTSGEWFLVDREFVGFGDIPPGADGGLNFGIGRFVRALRSGESLEVEEGIRVIGPQFATDHSTAELAVVVVVSCGVNCQTNRSVIPVSWVAPTGFPVTNFVRAIETDSMVLTQYLGRVTFGQLSTSTNLSIDAVWYHGGAPNLSYDSSQNDPSYRFSLPVYNRPVLTFVGLGPQRVIPLSPPVPGRYRIEVAEDLLLNNPVWFPIATNSFGPGAPGQVLVNPIEGPSQRFFRATLIP